MAAARLDEAAPVLHGTELDLVDGGRDAARGDDLVEVGGADTCLAMESQNLGITAKSAPRSTSHKVNLSFRLTTAIWGISGFSRLFRECTAWNFTKT